MGSVASDLVSQGLLQASRVSRVCRISVGQVTNTAIIEESRASLLVQCAIEANMLVSIK